MHKHENPLAKISFHKHIKMLWRVLRIEIACCDGVTKHAPTWMLHAHNRQAAHNTLVVLYRYMVHHTPTAVCAVMSDSMLKYYRIRFKKRVCKQHTKREEKKVLQNKSNHITDTILDAIQAIFSQNNKTICQRQICLQFHLEWLMWLRMNLDNLISFLVSLPWHNDRENNEGIEIFIDWNIPIWCERHNNAIKNWIEILEKRIIKFLLWDMIHCENNVFRDMIRCTP